MFNDDLKKTLELRAAVIQRALRTGMVGTQKLDELLTTLDWRTPLHEAIKAVVETPGGDSTAVNSRAPDPPAFTDVIDEPTSWWNPRRLLMQYAIVTRLDVGESADPHKDVLGIYDAFGLELLAGMQLRGRSAGQSLLDSLKTAGIATQRIRRLSAFRELFELLSTTGEKGRRTILLRLVGDVQGIVTPKPLLEEWARWIAWLAWLRTAFDEYRSNTIDATIMKNPPPDSTAASAAAADSAEATPAEVPREPLDWLYDFDLLQQIANAARRAPRLAETRQSEQGSRGAEIDGHPEWNEVIERQRGRDAAPSRRSLDATEDDAAAETLMQCQHRLVADATQILADATRILADAKPKIAKNSLGVTTQIQNYTNTILSAATQILGDPVRSQSVAEEIWWRSFELPATPRAITSVKATAEAIDKTSADTAVEKPAQTTIAESAEATNETNAGDSAESNAWVADQKKNESDSTWRAEDVATFCLGRERAAWLTSGQPVSGRPRVQSTCVASNPGETPSVVIFGAGVAGLTAAHELAERGIKVTVVDAAMPPDEKSGMRTDVGGMARTQWARASAWPHLNRSRFTPTSDALFPGEHGYRLFPSFYRHVFDTMKRTPILNVNLHVTSPTCNPPDQDIVVSPEQLGIRPTAFDQLQATHQQVFAKRGHFVPLRRDRTRSLEAFRAEYMNLHQGLEFPKRDMARFFFKLLRYLMTSSERRAAEYETKSLMAFFDPSLYSDGFLKAIQSAPQALVAMDAELCDARTQGNVYIQLLLDQILGSEYTDSTLRGPTSVAWFAHWYRYLESLDVTFVNAELLALRPAGPTATSRADTPVEVVFKTAPESRDSNLAAKIANARYIVVALDAVSAERVTRTWDSAGVPLELRGYASHVTEKLRAHLARYDAVITFKPSRSRAEAEDVMRRLLDRISVAEDDRTSSPRERSAFRNLHRATGQVPIPPGDVDEIQIALWFEHSAGKSELDAIERVLTRLLRSDGTEELRVLSDRTTWVETPETITTPRMSDNVFGENATDRFQTFIGVQYYFAHDFKLVRGHVYLPDTEWGLSAVSQGQFWPRRLVPDGVRGILSIDIGNCRRKSSYTHRTVMECTREEIAVEVWRQFADSMRTTRGPTSIVTSLPLPEPLSYHVDDNLVFTRDQGALRSNRSPFLVNNAGDWERRPRCQPWVPGRAIVVDAPRSDATNVWQAPHGGYRIHASSVVFCGTYMRTFTRMTTMEAANESARHAVNAILDHMAAHLAEHDHRPIAGDYCDIWDPEENELDDLAFFKRIDTLLFKAGKPHIADILQFDKIADLQYPDPSPLQALVASLGATIKTDWGITSTDLVTSIHGLLESAKQVVGGVSGGIAGAASQHPLLKLLGMLGIGKGVPPSKGS